ncbi:DUF4160 domain-containing protein [Acidithiobacillus sp. M4-SHS-6]|uniref:DUF4160 domain-containing protein n=1 Tax=Acidithiobacillus sp. M4-SHS-6 TaxID=3383024 RepID=UPI0039BDC5B9
MGRQTIRSRPCQPLACFTGLSSIYLYFFDDERHQLPHIHAKYQGQDASFSILDGSLLSGGLPQPKVRMVQAWIEIHREDLQADWDLAVNGQTPFPIDPLR